MKAMAENDKLAMRICHKMEAEKKVSVCRDEDEVRENIRVQGRPVVSHMKPYMMIINYATFLHSY